MTKSRLRVGVVFGGRSGEHEISLVSARNVMAHMDPQRYEVVPIGIGRNGAWLTGADVLERLDSPEAATGQSGSASRDLRMVHFDGALMPARDSVGRLDVIFPVLHGPMGEDGTIQGLLELAGIAYVGCGVTASAAAMDKAIAKDIFAAHGLPIVRHQVILRREWEQAPEAVIERLLDAFDFPLFVKPANLGSSVGINKVKDPDQLRRGLSEAARYDRKILVEEGIDARDIEVSVLGNDLPRASMPGEIVPSREFYSYAAKYQDADSELRIPAPLSGRQTEDLRGMAIDAFRALDCAGLARVDFLIDRASGRIYLNEVNTMPGFTAISMYPKLWALEGLEYAELISQLIELALERFEDKRRTLHSFDPSSAQ